MEHVSSMVLKYLDLRSIVKCREVCKEWKSIVEDHRGLWIRKLMDMKSEKIYFDKTKTIIQTFPEWEIVFDFYRDKGKAEMYKLMAFVIFLQSSFEFLRDPKRTWYEVLSPMHIEALRANHKFFRFFLDSPMDFNSKTVQRCKHDTDYGRTILHIACNNDDVGLVKFLFEHSKVKNLDLNLPDSLGNTPLHHACEKEPMEYFTPGEYLFPKEVHESRVDTVSYMLKVSSEFNLDLNARNIDNDPPIAILHYWDHGYELIMQFMIKGAEISQDMFEADVIRNEMNTNETMSTFLKFMKTTRALHNCFRNGKSPEEIVSEIAEVMGFDTSQYDEPSAKKSKM